MDREEWLDKKFKQAKQADGKRVVGKSAAVTVRDRQLSAIQPLADRVKPGTQLTEGFAPISEIRKRSAAERSLSLSSRLWRAAKENPAEMQLLLQRIQSDYWKSGRPIPYDEIKRVADQLVEVAEKEESEKYRKMVSH